MEADEALSRVKTERMIVCTSRFRTDAEYRLVSEAKIDS